jgi:hypothetical protein
METCGQAHRREAFARHEWRGSAVKLDGLRPVLKVSGQRDPTVAVDLPPLSEPTAARIDSQL